MNAKRARRLAAKHAKKQNIFSRIFDTIDTFDTIVDFKEKDIESLKGTFRLTRRTRKEITNVKGFFRFTDDAVQEFGFKKIKVNYKQLNSMFGNFGDQEDYLGSGRTVKSGNKKFDYLYNGVNENLQQGAKIAEVSLFPSFIDTFESKKNAKVKGDFRVNIDSNFVAMAKKDRNKQEFGDNLLLRAEFESDFDLINPVIPSLNNSPVITPPEEIVG